MFSHGLSSLRVPAAAFALAGMVLVVGCSNSSSPDGPAVTGPTTPRAALAALENAYIEEDAAAAIALHSPSFRFVPAAPDSVSFLGPGETEWGFDWETELLGRILVPGRTSWIDQVLFEYEILRIDDTGGRVVVNTKTDLIFVVGVSDLTQSRSEIDYVYERDGQGVLFLVEEVERPWLNVPGELTVGQLKSMIQFPPTIEARDPTTVGLNNAVVAARLNPNGLETTYHFEWGTDPSYGNVTLTMSAGDDPFESTVEATLVGLAQATTYHYRLVAESMWGESEGEDRSFTTLSP